MLRMSMIKRLFPLILLIVLLISCSHKYDSNTLDLAYYQWNLWPDIDADISSGPPTCGWEVLHRGNGKLVRIPAIIEEHFSDQYAGVSWFHCRFTLPDLWAEKRIVLSFEEAGPGVEVYLNEKLVGSHQGGGIPFQFDITPQVYYTRDNHLAIRITDPNGGAGGITGNLVVKSELTAF